MKQIRLAGLAELLPCVCSCHFFTPFKLNCECQIYANIHQCWPVVDCYGLAGRHGMVSEWRQQLHCHVLAPIVAVAGRVLYFMTHKFIIRAYVTHVPLLCLPPCCQKIAHESYLHNFRFASWQSLLNTDESHARFRPQLHPCRAAACARPWPS